MTTERSKYVIEVDQLPRGENSSRFDGHEHGAQVSFFLSHNRPGIGPELHRHPYEETFIVQQGRILFTVADQTIEATAGDIVVVPAGTPHKFVNAGSEPHRQISIHPAPRMETEWLE
jgi:mannose-6-phosphate isomerase-like protein (cupin superfamily)